MSSSNTEVGTIVDVTMPQMGVSVSEGTVVAWHKQVGDQVAYEETICEISTDKIDTDVPSPAAGRVTEILVPVDTTVDVGTVLARIATGAGASGEPAPARPADAGAADGEPAAAEPATDDAPAPAADPAPEAPAPRAPGANGGRSRGARRYSPVVSRIANEHGIDLDRVEGTGRGGRVRKQDVLAFLENGGQATEPPLHIESPYRPEPTPTPSPVAGGHVVERSRMRRSIGEHMKRSLETAATCSTWAEADMTRVERARAELGITALPIVARCTIDALREMPSLNATFEGEQLIQHDDVNLGIAVSLGEDGLIVPVIHQAQDLSAEGLAKRIRDLARRARTKELTPDEVRGGTFTITNPGQYGSIMATPVINQPQVAILDLEAIVKRPVVVSEPDGDDAIAIRAMTILGLSWDHRALDGALAAQFLTAVRRRLEAF